MRSRIARMVKMPRIPVGRVRTGDKVSLGRYMVIYEVLDRSNLKGEKERYININIKACHVSEAHDMTDGKAK
jgi:hypothetical protein